MTQLEYFLHEKCGYSYQGPNSLYGLTYPEIARLRMGANVTQKQQELAEKGVSQEQQAEFSQFADDINDR